MDAMKEANLVIGRKGKYKNLTIDESQDILKKPTIISLKEILNMMSLVRSLNPIQKTWHMVAELGMV